MIRQNIDNPLDEFVTAAKTVLEHNFNNQIFAQIGIKQKEQIKRLKYMKIREDGCQQKQKMEKFIRTNWRNNNKIWKQVLPPPEPSPL